MNEETKKRVLVIEDDKMLAKTISDALNDAGFEAENAYDGEEGLRLALEKKPALILLDILLPKMDGLTLLANLKKDAWGAHAKVITLSNLESTEAMARVLEADIGGLSGYFLKSEWKLDDLVKVVQEKVGK
ncbi:MAG: response regulator [Parcubacteria group bacterium]|nr:response regulator [Parcubacteria group bacterium]